MGPVVSAAQQERVLGMVDRAVADGAELLAGGSVNDHLPFLSEMPHGGFSTYALDYCTRIKHAMVRFDGKRDLKCRYSNVRNFLLDSLARTLVTCSRRGGCPAFEGGVTGSISRDRRRACAVMSNRWANTV